MTNEQIVDRISQISSFLVGYGDVAELAARKLRELCAEIEASEGKEQYQ